MIRVRVDFEGRILGSYLSLGRIRVTVGVKVRP